MLEPLRPPRFREPVRITAAYMTGVPPVFAVQKKRPGGARAAGIRYEKKVHEELLKQYPKHYLPSPWFRFYDAHGKRWCQPDGLFVDVAEGLLTIVEMKHHHTGEAWWKLQKLYLPVVRHVFGPDWRYACLEIVRWYDPEELFPGAQLCRLPHVCPPPPATGVHILKPRGEGAGV